MLASHGFHGTIQGATLLDLIQLECLAMSTRAVRVERANRMGRIYFAGGQIVHAVTGDLKGEVALFELLGWAGGNFYFEDGVRPMDCTIDRDWHGLLLEAAQRRDELPQAVPHVTSDPPSNMTAIPMPKLPIADVFRDPEVLQAVQFTDDGTLLESKSDDPDTMQASFAYIEQLSRLIGTALGAEGLHEIQIVSADKKALCAITDSTTSVVVTTLKANSAALLTKLS